MASSPNEAVENGLLAIVASNGKCRKAERLLQSRGVHNINAKQLYVWKQEHQARYEELREQHAPDMEKRLTSGLRDTSMLASEAMQEAVSQALKRLEKGDDKDPAKTAALLASTSDKALRNMLALQGRPTSISENRGIEASLRWLVANGILRAPEEPGQLQEATVEATSEQPGD